MSHTPGPWRWVQQRGTSERQGRRLTGGANIPIVWQHHCCSEANALLIAAAPDLLEACKAVLEAMNIPGPALPMDVCIALHRAIAKATTT